MKTGEMVQIRQFDGNDHWIYAVVIDPSVRLVQVQHKGNVDDGKQMTMAAQDIRTSTDVQNLINACAPICQGAHPQHGLSEAQVRQLGALDGFWLQFLKLDEKHQAQRLALHNLVGPHYQTIMKRMS